MFLNTESFQKWFREVDEDLSSNLQNSGFQNTSFIGNISFILPLFAISIIVTVISMIMLIFKKTRAKGIKFLLKFK